MFHKEINQLKKDLEASAQVAEMTKTDGWKIVKAHFTALLKAIVTQILKEPDPQKILVYQERFRAFQSMLETVDSFVFEYLDYSAKLESIDQNQQSDEYEFS